MFKPIYQLEQTIQEAQKLFSRGEVAKYKVALHQIDRTLKMQMNEILANPQSVDVHEFNRLKEIQLFLFQNIGRLEEKLKNSPYAKKDLTFEDQKKIYHTYHAGYNTQEQLAGFYGVKQPTISKIVNNHEKFAVK